jgi:predicted RNA-binding Zn-ribbon protein involved in translation (DUF1610 family)
VTDLERFFRRLVENLAGTDPARLHRPLPLEDILQVIVPYRANRRTLGLDSSEEYELVVLRLCAGEGGLARTEPEEVRARFAEELRSPHPDLAVLHSFESVLVSLRPEPLARALGSSPEPPEVPAPEPEDMLGPEEVLEPDPEPETVPAAEPATQCPYCGGRLPTGRPVNFCPHCGQSQILMLCPECRSEVEPGWKHCVNCGCAVAEG